MENNENKIENDNVVKKEKKNNVKFLIIGLVVIIIILAIVVVLGSLGNKDKVVNKNKIVTKKIDWSEIELSEYMPEPEKAVSKISINRSDLAIVEIRKLTKKEYKDYVRKCIGVGYNIDLEFENWDTVYGAFNEEGYSIRISYIESLEEMSITLKIPEKTKMKEFEWPTNGLGAMLPKPISNLGNVSWDNSEKFIVHLGNISKNDYNEYVKTCEDIGFSNEHSKSEKSYRAKNSEGYEVHLMYLGANVIEISIKAPEGKTITNTNTPTSNENTKPTEETQAPTTTSNNNSTEIGQEFKKAMDSYETFMDEYVTFMKKYSSNPSDLELLKDYANMMSKYQTAMKDFEKWNSSDLNKDEQKYYIEVQTRVTKKLSDAAIDMQ